MRSGDVVGGSKRLTGPIPATATSLFTELRFSIYLPVISGFSQSVSVVGICISSSDFDSKCLMMSFL